MKALFASPTATPLESDLQTKCNARGVTRATRDMLTDDAIPPPTTVRWSSVLLYTADNPTL